MRRKRRAHIVDPTQTIHTHYVTAAGIGIVKACLKHSDMSVAVWGSGWRNVHAASASSRPIQQACAHSLSSPSHRLGPSGAGSTGVARCRLETVCAVGPDGGLGPRESSELRHQIKLLKRLLYNNQSGELSICRSVQLGAVFFLRRGAERAHLAYH